jgi:hypothetical protein
MGRQGGWNLSVSQGPDLHVVEVLQRDVEKNRARDLICSKDRDILRQHHGLKPVSHIRDSPMLDH